MTTHNSAGVYRIVHCEQAKMYIGSSVDIRARLQAHKNRLRRGRHDNCHLQAAWNRDGEAAFEFEPLASCDLGELARIEQWWVDYYRANHVALYNQRPVVESNLGLKQSAESRQKMSAAKSITSPETRARMSASAKAFRATHPKVYSSLSPRPKWTEEQKENLRGRLPWNKGKSGHRLALTEVGREAKRAACEKKRGTHHSEESRAKMSAAKLGRALSVETRAKMSESAMRGWDKRRAAQL